jgi:3'-5' exonuclease
MTEHVIVWDLETVPDLDAVARAHYLPEPAVEVAREVLGENFPKLPFHQIVCIGAVVAEKVDGVWWVTAIGAPHIGERSEKELIAAFVEKIAALKPSCWWARWPCLGRGCRSGMSALTESFEG